jgi:hypothetical protein
MPVRLSMRLALAIPFALAILAPTIARADQCAINDQAIADKAVELLKLRAQMLEFCEPCGEKVPTGPYAITNVATADGKVTIEGKIVDLAYTYILVGKHTYQNLGILAGCKAERVSMEVIDSRPLRYRPATPQPNQGQTLGGGVGRVPGAPPPRPPGGMHRTRVSKPDDIAGTWTVNVRSNLSTCKGAAGNRTESWTITVANDTDIVINQGTGADDFVGTQTSLAHGTYKPQLSTKNRPSANVLQITQSMRDTFWGKITRAESSGKKTDPACLTVLDVSGTRVP